MLDAYHLTRASGSVANAAANRAVLVALDFGERGQADAVAEFKLLCSSAGLAEQALVGGTRQKPDPALYAGRGKVEEIAAAVAQTEAEVVVFNHMLAPAQQRNLEGKLQVRVVDRTTLILDIFAQRAKSHEGKIQVELAQLQHLATRLVRGWTHLERQKGGIGLRGPGETQLETDRRLLGVRVKLLREKLEKLQRQREVQRRARHRGRVFSVSLVGYTNAGKSTLFNALTKADSYAADQLFATLDTTSRQLHLPCADSANGDPNDTANCSADGDDSGGGSGNDGGGGRGAASAWSGGTQSGGRSDQLVVSDTVGFIRELPITLVAAFRATLEETIHADLLLHVVDAASPARLEQIEEVNAVLKEIGAEAVPQILIWNKIDAAISEGGARYFAGLERDEYAKICRLFLSARSREGLPFLRQALSEAVAVFKHRQRPNPTGPTGAAMTADAGDLVAAAPAVSVL